MLCYLVICWFFCVCFIWFSLEVNNDELEGVWFFFLFCLLVELFVVWDLDVFDGVVCGELNESCVNLILLSFWISVEVLILFIDEGIFWSVVCVINVLDLDEVCVFEVLLGWDVFIDVLVLFVLSGIFLVNLLKNLMLLNDELLFFKGVLLRLRFVVGDVVVFWILKFKYFFCGWS